MLNQYGGFLPNTTIESVVGGQSALFYGNDGGPAFAAGNYPTACSPHPDPANHATPATCCNDARSARHLLSVA